MPFDSTDQTQYIEKHTPDLYFMEETSDCHKFYFVLLAKNKKHSLKLPLKLGWCMTEFVHGMWEEVRYTSSHPGDEAHVRPSSLYPMWGYKKMKKPRLLIHRLKYSCPDSI